MRFLRCLIPALVAILTASAASAVTYDPSKPHIWLKPDEMKVGAVDIIGWRECRVVKRIDAANVVVAVSKCEVCQGGHGQVVSPGSGWGSAMVNYDKPVLVQITNDGGEKARKSEAGKQTDRPTGKRGGFRGKVKVLEPVPYTDEAGVESTIPHVRFLN